MKTWSKKHVRKYTASALSLLLMCNVSGCNDGSKSNVKSKLTYDGIWVAEGYGQALKIADNKFTFYDFTPSFCRISEIRNLTKSQAEKAAWKIDANQKLRQRFTMHGIDFRTAAFDKKTKLPTACNTPIPDDSVNSKFGALSEFAWFTELFDNYYPTFEQRNINWQLLSSENQKFIKGDNDIEGLAKAMTESIRPLQDGHVSVSKGDFSVEFSNTVNVKEYKFLNEYIALNGPLDSPQKQAESINYINDQNQKVTDIKLGYANADGIKTAFNGNMKWYVTPENVGVLIIDSMMGADEEGSFSTLVSKHINELATVMPEVMKGIRNTSGLIIDIRENGGGIDGFSQYIARYFLDKPRNLYKKQYRVNNHRSTPELYYLSPINETYTKPIALLTSGSTVSAAEVFALMMRNLPNVTLAGETSQGAISDILSATLPSGIEVNLVNEYYTSMADELFEVTGIPVDVDIPYATQQQRLEGKDQAYEHFIQKFKVM